MFQPLGNVTLKTEEVVQMGVVTAPDTQWFAAITGLLNHKGPPWGWHIEQTLLHAIGVTNRFYILHRDGVPFSNIMTSVHAGVALFGHVFTTPEDRRKGAASILNDAVMKHFRDADAGQAMYLVTGFDTPPFHIYRGCGFQGMEPGSGFMCWHREGQATFERQWFAPGPTVIEPVAWPHWVSACPLFAGELPGVVKCAGAGVLGRCISESPLMKFLGADLPRREQGQSPRGYVLRQTHTQAVLGIALLTHDPMWHRGWTLDVYCHPDHWSRAGDLIAQIAIPDDGPVIAYADASCPAKLDALHRAGFKQTATLHRRLWTDCQRQQSVDVIQLER
jgi:hypothetical protein